MTGMLRFGRYVVHDEFASGGMASLHFGRTSAPDGAPTTVAIKRLHPHVAAAPGALAMFRDEARLSAHIRHRNVVATLDVIGDEHELLLVMEYVHGVSLSVLEDRARDAGCPVPLEIASAIAIDMLEGLDAAHRATDERGAPLAIVHRDVSPQNVLVGADGVSRVIDFGIAKAAVRLQTTRDGQLKGKLRYMAPEQLQHDAITVRTDVYGASAVLWELLTGKKLFVASSEGATVAKVLEGVVIAPTRVRPDVPAALGEIAMRGLSRDPAARFASCHEMAAAIAAVVAPATALEVAEWVANTAPDVLRDRASRIARLDEVAAAAPVPSVLAEIATVTLAKPIGEARPRLSRWAWLPFALGAGACGAVLIAVVSKRGGTDGPSSAPTSMASSAASAPVVVASAHEPPPAPPSPAPAPASAPAPSPHVVSVGSAVARPAVRPPPTRSWAPSARPGCTPMYTVGPDGIKHLKPECL